jgi:hypothetical protein
MANLEKTINVSGTSIRITNEMSQQFEGDVIITDPCYFIKDEIWSALCGEAWFDNGKNTPFTDGGTLYYNGATILYSSTAHGDGSYDVTEVDGIRHSSFGVDAGMMAIVTREDLEKISNEDFAIDTLCAYVEDFHGTVDADGDGNFTGNLEVWTDGSKEEDDEEDSWMDEDEDDDDYSYRDDDRY